MEGAVECNRHWEGRGGVKERQWRRESKGQGAKRRWLPTLRCAHLTGHGQILRGSRLGHLEPQLRLPRPSLRAGDAALGGIQLCGQRLSVLKVEQAVEAMEETRHRLMGWEEGRD